MNNNDNTLPRISEIINKGTSGAIVIPANPSPDAICSATSLYLGLSKMNKSITLVSAIDNVNNPDIIASDKIQSNLVTGGDNLVVSFPYADGAIDKVDYNIQGSSFNLVIAPRQGYPKLDPKQVKFSYSGGNLDFLIIIDSPTLNSLGSIYSDNQNQFQGKEIINIDRHLTNGFYGTVNMVNKTSSSISEIIFKLLQSLRVEMDHDISTNLYYGISAATNNFTSYSVNANTFEIIAALLRMGALKKSYKKIATTNPPTFSQPFRQVNQPQQYQQKSNPEVKNAAGPIEDVEKAPQDWLKPKIFRGSDLI